MQYSIFLWPGTERVFIDIAKVLMYAFHRKGFACHLTHELNCNLSGTNIIFGANCIIRVKIPTPIPKNSIIINMEQLYNESMWVTDAYLDLLKTHTVWDYNKSNQKWIQNRIGKTVPLLTFGYCPFLDQIPLSNLEDIDVLFYGGLNERRHKILRDLTAAKINAVFRNNDLWGAKRDGLISRAKIVLNLHYYPTALFEIPRISYLLNNHKFVISEVSTDQDEYVHLQPGLVICPYDQLLITIKMYLAHPEYRNEIADMGYNLIRAHHPTVPEL